MRRLRGDGLPWRSGYHTGQPAHGEQHVDRSQRCHHVDLRHLLPHARQFRAGQDQRLLLGRGPCGRVYVGRRFVAHGPRQRYVRRAEQHDERFERLDGLDETLHGRQRRQRRAEVRPDGADDRYRAQLGDRAGSLRPRLSLFLGCASVGRRTAAAQPDRVGRCGGVLSRTFAQGLRLRADRARHRDGDDLRHFGHGQIRRHARCSEHAQGGICPVDVRRAGRWRRLSHAGR